MRRDADSHKLIEDPAVVGLAGKYGKSPAQVQCVVLLNRRRVTEAPESSSCTHQHFPVTVSHSYHGWQVVPEAVLAVNAQRATS